MLGGVCQDGSYFLSLHNSQAILTLHTYFTVLSIGLLVQLVSHVTMNHPLTNATSAALNPLLDLNLNMNLNPEITVHDDMYSVKYSQPDTLYDAMLFEPLKRIRVSHDMFKATSLLISGLTYNPLVS